MKIRVTNKNPNRVKVILEPWGNEFDLASRDYIDFVAEKGDFNSAFFNIEYTEQEIIVCAESEGFVVVAYDSKGNLLC